MDYSLLFKFFKFGIVGFSGLSIDFLTTWVCKEKVEINKYVANSLGFVLATVNNFFLNRFWTFEEAGEASVEQFFTYLGVSVIGLLMNNLIIVGLNDKLKINFYVAKLTAVFIVVIWNFVGNYFVTFA